MEFLNLIASVTRRGLLRSELTAEAAILLQPFGWNDNLAGKITCVAETGNPVTPVEDFPIDSSSGVALTDGQGTVYGNAVILPVTNTNELNFTMVVDSVALQDALAATDNDFVNAYLEVRAVKDSQDVMILREPCVITKTATLAGVPVAVRSVIYNTTIDHLRDGDPDTSLEGLSTLLPSPIPTLSLLIIVKDGAVSFWELVTGDADDTDPDGQVRPLDYSDVTNNRHWQKVGGL